MIIDINGAKRHTMNSDELKSFYKKMENFIADCTFEEYEENKDAVNAVLSLIHKHLRLCVTQFPQQEV